MQAERTLVDLLRLRAVRSGERLAYTFLADGERETLAWTYADLDRRARAIAAHLQARGSAGDRVLLAYPPGLEFIAAFFGCLYARMIAVPVPILHPRRGQERLDAVVGDCRPVIRLGPDTEIEETGAWVATLPLPDDVAFLQYTSGSTAAPKGVKVSHANVLANLAMIQAAEGNDASSRGLSWLPAYHDMGLVEGILEPLYVGYPTWLMPPPAFLQRPVRWLQAVSRHAVTVSGAPDFAYALCTRRIADEDLAGVDLSTWRVAYNGSEPVSARTLEEFAQRFAGCRFEKRALRPVYGLAEATLLVSASAPEREAPHNMRLDAAALAEGRVEPAAEADAGAVAVVSCGRPADGTRVVILGSGPIGEICVAGPAVAQGYWGSDAPSDWLRTGDLGFLHAGELYVTGRIKDLIILRGRKLYPQDIERSIEDCHDLVGAAAAFAVQEQHLDQLVVVAEVERTEAADWQPVLDAIAEAAYRRHECAIAATVLVRRGTLPRTSSGKLMRFRCRENFLEGRLHELARAEQRAPEDRWAA